MALSYPLKVGLIGAGYWGQNLLRVFHELGALKIICDLDENILAKRKEQYPDLETTNDFQHLLDDDTLTGIIIASPAVTHYELAKKVLLAGKDAFVEKPLALEVAEGEELTQLAATQGRILMVGHLLLYHPAIIELKKRITQGDLGTLCYICSNRLNFGKLRREENVLWSFAPHDIAVIIDFLGVPNDVYAVGRAYLQNDIPDITLSTLSFNDSRSAHIFISWLNPFKEQRLTVIGSEAMAVFDDQAVHKLVVYRHRIQWSSNGAPEAVKVPGEVIVLPADEPLRKEAEHFLECMETRAIPRTDGAEAVEVLKVLEACQKSLNKNSLLLGAVSSL